MDKVIALIEGGNRKCEREWRGRWSSGREDLVDVLWER